ncbi:LysE family transporter [Klebsiella pneumoniae]|uniref:LysE family transporter n=1 Tax=Klebsiella pneumoniae TaxID=573 RepID=UPI00388DE1CA
MLEQSAPPTPIWLGIQQWRAAGAIDLNTLAKAQTRGKLFQRAVFVNLTKSQKHCFSGRPVSQFILLPHQPQVMQYIVLGVTTIVVDIVMIGWRDPCAAHFRMDQRQRKKARVEQKVWFTVYALVGALLASARHA